MKKSLIIITLTAALLLAACASQASSPKRIATYCAIVPLVMPALEQFHALGPDSSAAEYAAAYEKAVTAGIVMREASKGMNEQEVKDFSQAINQHATALEYIPSLPAAAGYAAAMADVKQQYLEVLKAYEAVAAGICAP
jgi:hypothetical protein